ncbi:MAG: GNAT family N-acetyltransferase [Pseudomonadota bacterium]
MPPDSRIYGFEPLRQDDLDLLRRWLTEPHVAAFWGPVEDEIASLREHLDRDLDVIALHLVTLDGQPFAFVQSYPTYYWPSPQYADLPAGAQAIDTFLGDPAFLGQGHGSGYIRARAVQLVAEGASLVAVDPAPGNARAIAAYRRAGFEPREERLNEEGEMALVMTFPADPGQNTGLSDQSMTKTDT